MPPPVGDLTRFSPPRDDAQQASISTRWVGDGEATRRERELKVFLDTSSAADLRHLLELVIRKSSEAKSIACDEIRAGNDRISYAASQVRGDQRWKVCLRCKKPYDTKDDDLVCVKSHHPGELELNYDSDVWADWQEGFERDEFPEGFIFTCCKQTGDTEKGCVEEEHHVSD